jgi:putative toxin-antitoxin system antitoxin component (TIGR02293 family)
MTDSKAHSGGKRGRKTVRYDHWDDWQAVRRVGEGLATGTLDVVRESFDLTYNELSDMVQISPRTLARRRTQTRLRPDESERVYRLLKLKDLASDVLGDDDEARAWFREPNHALAEIAPLDLANTEPGVAIVVRLLNQIQHGIVS